MQTSTEFVVDFIEFIDSNRIELNRIEAQHSASESMFISLFHCFFVTVLFLSDQLFYSSTFNENCTAVWLNQVVQFDINAFQL